AVEHMVVFHGQPGKLRVLAWRNRAVTASYDDALAYLRDHPGANPEAILQVRNGEKIKYGLGVSIEQALNSDAGVFLRAMKADGRTETYAFTEVDASLGGGVSLKGTSWGRPQDTVGVGLMGNYLSRDRRQYLEAGGISFFIGDGFLNYRPERIFETYYSFAVLKDLSLTADFQRIDNPAYNADRGPVNIWSLRAHAEF
ncbi:MAG: carbohydrate porin, partial [Zoogloea sp.]|nr:carbohydrate porin [Zoogloea sp.]